MNRWCLPVVALLLSAPALAEKRAFTIEDRYRVKELSDMAVSPDPGDPLHARVLEIVSFDHTGAPAWRARASNSTSSGSRRPMRFVASGILNA